MKPEQLGREAVETLVGRVPDRRHVEQLPEA